MNYVENRTVRGRTIAGFAILELTATLDPASVPGNTAPAQALTFAGLQVGDHVISLSKPTTTVNLGIGQARVSAVDELTVTFINTTAGAIDPASEVYTVVVLRPDAGQGPGLN